MFAPPKGALAKFLVVLNGLRAFFNLVSAFLNPEALFAIFFARKKYWIPPNIPPAIPPAIAPVHALLPNSLQEKFSVTLFLH